MICRTALVALVAALLLTSSTASAVEKEAEPTKLTLDAPSKRNLKLGDGIKKVPRSLLQACRKATLKLECNKKANWPEADGDATAEAKSGGLRGASARGAVGCLTKRAD